MAASLSLDQSDRIRRAIALLTREVAEVSEPGPSLVDIKDVYLADLKTRASSEHYRTTKRQLDKIVAAVGPSIPSPLAVLRYRQHRIAEGPQNIRHRNRHRPALSNRSANMDVNALRACLNWAVEEAQILGANPIAGVKSLPHTEAHHNRRSRALSDDEVDRLLDESRRLDEFRACPQTPLWRLLIETGIRWGDAMGLRPSHVRADCIVLEAITAKGKRSREIPIPPDLALELGTVLPFRTPKGRLWSPKNGRNGRRLFLATVVRAGIRWSVNGKQVFVHALRKTAASRMLRRGVPLPIVSAMLGHKDPSLTARLYVEITGDQLRDAMRPAWIAPLAPAASEGSTAPRHAGGRCEHGHQPCAPGGPHDRTHGGRC